MTYLNGPKLNTIKLKGYEVFESIDILERS